MTSDGENLTGLWFEDQKYAPAMTTHYSPENPPQVFAQTQQWLEVYFSGKAPDFTPPIFLSSTPFRMAVWEILRAIPYGQTMTYGQIAHILADKSGLSGMSAQAVGGAVGRNPISLIVPCHRVIGANGSLTGYAAGLERKAFLLALEKQP